MTLYQALVTVGAGLGVGVLGEEELSMGNGQRSIVNGGENDD